MPDTTSVAAAKNSQDPDILATAAITAALASHWQEAVKINEKILTSANNDVEALNRLARARVCLGETTKAQKTYKKVLEIDPYNIIALKNMEKLGKTNGISKTNGAANINLSQVFLYEPGKTKLVNLLNLAPPTILASLNCGDQVKLNPKNHSISIISENGTYLGAFPDDFAHRLLSLISGGNQYEVYVKSATLKTLTVLIRETERSVKFANQPSFQSQNSNFFNEKDLA